MQSEILIWSNETEFIRINEGTGDNLLREDQEEGYVDYIDFKLFVRKIEENN